MNAIHIRVIPVGPRRLLSVEQDFALLISTGAAEVERWHEVLPWNMGLDPSRLVLVRIDKEGRVLGRETLTASDAPRSPSVQGTDAEIGDVAQAWLRAAFDGTKVTDENGKLSLLKADKNELPGLLSSMWALPGDLPRRLDLIRWFRGVDLAPGERFFVVPSRVAIPETWALEESDGEVRVAGVDGGTAPMRWIANVVEVAPLLNGRLRFKPHDEKFNDHGLGPRIDTGWLHVEIADPLEDFLHRAIVAAAHRFLKPQSAHRASVCAPVIWSAIRSKLSGLRFRDALEQCSRARVRDLLFESTSDAIPESERAPPVAAGGSQQSSGVPTEPLHLDDLLEPLFGKDPSAPRPVPTGAERVVEPLRVRFGDIEDGDAWSRLQGVVVFVRDATAEGPWHCLNTARLQLAGGLQFRCTFTPSPSSGHPSLTPHPVALIPSRVVEREGVTLPVESYLNRSLVFGDSLSLALGETADLSLGQARYLRPDLPRPFFQLPRLVFGREYQFAAAMVDHGGGLPDELSGAGGASPRPSWDLGAMTLDSLSIPESTARHRFLRRVPLGAPTVVAPGDRWPTPPPHVELLLDARRPPSRRDNPSRDAAAAANAIDDGIVAGRFWLIEDGAAYALEVRTPVCARDVFECWVDDQATLRAGLSWYLRRVRAGHAQQSAIDFDDPGARVLQIDVDTWRWTSLHRSDVRLFEGVWEAAATFRIELDEPSFEEGAVRSRALRVVRSHGGSVSLQGDVLALPSMSRGETALFRVRLRARPCDEDIQRFAADLQASPEIAVLVELPGDALVAAEVLWDGFSVVRDGSSVDASISLSRETPGLRNVRDWSVVEQEWRWSGLPHDLVLRAEEAVTDGVLDKTNEDERAWEVQMFGARGNSDTLTQRAPWYADDDALPLKPGRAMSISLPRNSDRADLRRLTLVAHGRYAGFGFRQSSVARRPEANDASWLVALRGPRREPAKPVIRAAIPMASGPGAVGKFFVALRGAGYSAAGFTEGLEARFALDLPEGIPVGRDPTSGSSANQATVPPGPLSVQGPWGSTLDVEGTSDPHWISSAWIVTLPEGVMPWDFVWLQVRTLASRQNPLLGASPWSEPIALQALPNSAGVLRWGRDGAFWTLDDWRSFEDGRAPADASVERSSLLLIVTRETQDIEGRVLERLDSLYYGELHAGRWRFGHDDHAFNPCQEKMVARVAELQHPTWKTGAFPLKPGRVDLDASHEQLWDLLLPTDETEPSARIVRISDAIEPPL